MRNSPRSSPKVPRRTPVKRGACAVSPLSARKKSLNPKCSPVIQRNRTNTDAIIEDVLSPSPILSPIVTVKQQKDRENEQEKLRLINEILSANLPGANSTALNNNNLQKGSLANKPSKIPIYQNMSLANRSQNEVRYIGFRYNNFNWII